MPRLFTGAGGALGVAGAALRSRALSSGLLVGAADGLPWRICHSWQWWFAACQPTTACEIHQRVNRTECRELLIAQLPLRAR